MSVNPRNLVLVVEDDEENQLAISMALELEGYEVVTAGHGAVALELLADLAERCCLILLDLTMPTMSGYEFRERQMAMDGLRDIPVVLLSAGEGLDGKATEMQVAACVAKPVGLDDLLATVATHRRA